jgi:hypothetical protein
VNTAEPDTSLSCVCDGKMLSLTIRYIGPSNQDIFVTSKKCNIPLLDVLGATTGDVFTIEAASAGLQYLRKETYFELGGTSFDKIEIPTNCCDDPIGRVFFPFEVIGWTDTEGNSCGNGSSLKLGTSRPTSNVESEHVVTEMISQYPNPASDHSIFEFVVEKPGMVTLSIIDIHGKVIAKVYEGMADASIKYTHEYDISELRSGIYFVNLDTSNGNMKDKFVVIQ